MVSVIIPIYKVEQYLDRCIESIVNQTIVDLEIILVDDGSPDKCPKKCDEWATKDKRIKVIHKENGGLGRARNTGLEAAHGEWISFVDSDDYINESTYENCIHQLEKDHADICYFGSSIVNANGELTENLPHFPNCLEGTSIRNEILPKCFGRFQKDSFKIGSACMGVYRHSMLNQYGIRFVSERELISEDYVFTADVCAVAKKITFLNNNLYYYCMNPNSLSHSYRADRFEKISYFYQNRIAMIDTMHLGQEAKIRAGTRYWELTIGCLKQEIKSNSISKENKLRRIREVCGSPISKTLLADDTVASKMNSRQRILLQMIKHNMVTLVYWIVKLK